MPAGDTQCAHPWGNIPGAEATGERAPLRQLRTVASRRSVLARRFSHETATESILRSLSRTALRLPAARSCPHRGHGIQCAGYRVTVPSGPHVQVPPCSLPLVFLGEL
ncbi:MAG: hypothetical protein ACI89E_000591 [Planctomycetota bacterium]|jgi:hypothetical protein